MNALYLHLLASPRSLLAGLLALAFLASCTPNWRKISDQADLLVERGDLDAAAEAYLQAYAEKPTRTELTYQAGDLYAQLRDYVAAAQAYAPAVDKLDDFPLAGLKYGRSLKQSGDFNGAISELQQYLDAYPGPNKAEIEEVVYREIEGARLALRATMPADPNLSFGRLDAVINSDGQEYAPLSFPNDVLYFTSTVGGKAQLYRTQRDGETWARPSVPETFPRIQGQAYGHGSLAPDGTRFYFTMCGESTVYNPTTNPCAIYVLKRISGVWSQPERLSDLINQVGAVTTQPFVVHRDGKEWLFFASNRSGGAGGMDIWYTSRNLQGETAPFASPSNLGPSVNSSGHEMTPYYDTEDGVLYFASNGLPTMGGFDIFRTEGFMSNWSEAKNMGLPYNSPADDYYLELKGDGSGAYLASNRLVDGEKTSTRHDDLFELTTRVAPITLTASVFDGRSNQPVENFSVRVFEKGASGGEQVMINQPFSGGTYSVDLVPGRTYRIEVTGTGYQPYSYEINMESGPNAGYGRPVYLNPLAPGGYSGTGGSNRVIDPGGTPYTAKGVGPRDNTSYTSSAPRYAGTYYRVQLVALRNFIPSRFANVESVAQEVVTEYLPRQDLHRVLAGPYFSREEAASAMRRLRNLGYNSAYVVEYRDGNRYGRVNF